MGPGLTAIYFYFVIYRRKARELDWEDDATTSNRSRKFVVWWKNESHLFLYFQVEHSRCSAETLVIPSTIAW